MRPSPDDARDVQDRPEGPDRLLKVPTAHEVFLHRESVEASLRQVVSELVETPIEREQRQRPAVHRSDLLCERSGSPDHQAVIFPVLDELVDARSFFEPHGNPQNLGKNDGEKYQENSGLSRESKKLIRSSVFTINS